MDTLTDNELLALARERTAEYVDMGHFRYPEKATPYLVDGFQRGYREALKRTSEWVSVEDRLPEDGEEIFVFTGKEVAIDLYEDETFQYDNWAEHMNIAGGNCRTVTHWMPLPQPPKGDE